MKNSDFQCILGVYWDRSVKDLVLMRVATTEEKQKQPQQKQPEKYSVLSLSQRDC